MAKKKRPAKGGTKRAPYSGARAIIAGLDLRELCDEWILQHGRGNEVLNEWLLADMVRRVGKERVLVWRAQEQADGKDHDPYPFLSEGAEEGNGTEG
jgi:hypothetical protein